MEKKIAYDQWVREIKHRSFSLLVFSTTGSMGTTATVVYKRLASMISEKHEKQWIRCQLSFSLLCSVIMCLHRSWSSWHHPDHHQWRLYYIAIVCRLLLFTFLIFTFVSWILSHEEKQKAKKKIHTMCAVISTLCTPSPIFNLWIHPWNASYPSLNPIIWIGLGISTLTNIQAYSSCTHTNSHATIT